MLKEIWEMINEAVLNSTIGYHNIFIFMGQMMVLELIQNMNAFGDSSNAAFLNGNWWACQDVFTS